MKEYSIAVLLSSYNGAAYIEQQIDSILQQRHSERITLFVRDDGSKDGTIEILRRYTEKCACIEATEGENIGAVASFSALLQAAVERDYDYYAFSDQDDVWLPDKLDAAVGMLEPYGNTPAMYGGCSLVVDSELKKTGRETRHQLREFSFYNTAIQNICPGHSQVLNAAMAEIVQACAPDPSRVYSMDLWVTNVAMLRGHIVFDGTPHTLYRQHSANQLGYGGNPIQWVRDRLYRLRNREVKKMSVQLEYTARRCRDFLTEEQREEIDAFFASQCSLQKRLGYIRRTRLYRQEDSETAIFRLLYLLGAYRVKAQRKSVG